MNKWRSSIAAGITSVIWAFIHFGAYHGIIDALTIMEFAIFGFALIELMALYFMFDIFRRVVDKTIMLIFRVVDHVLKRLKDNDVC